MTLPADAGQAEKGKGRRYLRGVWAMNPEKETGRSFKGPEDEPKGWQMGTDAPPPAPHAWRGRVILERERIFFFFVKANKQERQGPPWPALGVHLGRGPHGGPRVLLGAGRHAARGRSNIFGHIVKKFMTFALLID